MKNQNDIMQQIIQRETTLHQPEFRQDVQTVAALLHEAFAEIGRSGKLTHRTEVIDALQKEFDQPVIQAEDFKLDMLSHEVVILRYRSYVYDEHQQKTKHTLRSSVWVNTDQHGWQMRFHQGTPTQAR